MSWFVEAIRHNPELAIFLTLALGFLIGKVRIGGFSFGTVVGTLLAGVIVGQLNIQVPAIVKTVFFDLFLFTTGYKVGPQFFRGLKKDAVSQVLVTVVLCVTCLVAAVVAARVLGYDMGTAAGLLAGAFSESTVIGTAGDAINRLPSISAEEKARLVNNIPVAYAVTYLVGTAVLVWFLPTIGPKLMGVNLREEAKKLAAQGAGAVEAEPGVISAARRFDVRAYRVTNDAVAGKTAGQLEALPTEFRFFILRVRRGNTLIDVEPATPIRRDDVVAVATRLDAHVERGDRIGPEVTDRELLDIPIEVLDVVITSKATAGKSLAELARGEFARGIFLQKLARAGEEMPIAPETRVDRGDVMTLIGPKPAVEQAIKRLGYPDRPTAATDMIFVGAGIVLGGFVGLLSVIVAGVPITLTASGGALIMGLVFGWLRSVRPFFGRIPEAAVWIFDTVGLCVFIGVVGITAGPGFVAGLQKTGVSLVIVGLICSLTPHVVTILFGRYVLRMNPLILLGACSGAGTITAALRALQEEAQSKVPAVGYTVPYAIGNILLTAWGPVLVALLSIGR
jgi:putative transport protein